MSRLLSDPAARRHRRGIAILLVTAAQLSTALVVMLPTASATPPGVPEPGVVGYLDNWGFDVHGSAGVPASLRSTEVIAVEAGGYHDIALTAEHTIVVWGSNDDGTSDPPGSLTGQKVVAVAAGEYHDLALTDAGLVVGWGLDSSGQSTVPYTVRQRHVTAIAAGAEHSLALTDDGAVLAWGANGSGQASVPASLDGTQVTAVAAGRFHSLALTAAGRIVGWGDNTAGESVSPAALTGLTVTAIAAGDGWSLALTSTGQVVAWGYGDDGQTQPPGITGATAIAAGYYNGVALANDGLVAWGLNQGGSNQHPGRKIYAVAAGSSNTLVITGPALQFVHLPPPVSVRAGDPYRYAFSTVGADGAAYAVASGNLPPGLTLGADGTLSGTSTVAGSYTFRVTADNGTDPAATTEPLTITVAAAAPARVSAVSGGGQSAAAGTAYASPLVAAVSDRFGNPVAGADVVFTLPVPTSADAGATLPGGAATATVTSGSDGTATSPVVTAGTAKGGLTASAAVDGVPDPATWSLNVITAKASDLGVEITAPAKAKTHRSIKLRVVISSAGPAAAHRVRTRITVPAGWKIIHRGGGTRVSSHTVRFRRSTLAAGHHVRYQLTVRTSRTARDAVLRAKLGARTPDPVPSNNAATAPVRLS